MNKQQLGKYFAQWARSEGNFCPSKEAQKRVRMMAEYLLEQGEVLINGVQYLSLHAEPAHIWIGAGANRYMGIETIEVSFVPIQEDQVNLWEGERKELIQAAFGYKPLRISLAEAWSFDFIAHVEKLLEISRNFQEFYPMLKKVLDQFVENETRLKEVTQQALRNVVNRAFCEFRPESKLG